MSASADQDTVDERITVDVDDLAARLFGPTSPAVRVEFGAISHPGKVRLNNEDHFSVVRRRRSREVLLTNLPDGVVPKSLHDDVYAMAVADGIGGAAFGELASMLALQAGWDLTTHAFKWHFQVNETEADEVEELLKVYGQLIHRKLQDEAAHDPRLAGMGTTITGALSIGTDAFIAHVGDSRAYLFRDGSLERLTRDHCPRKRRTIRKEPE
jgi:serine/threonine protein phosphatase PrpC